MYLSGVKILVNDSFRLSIVLSLLGVLSMVYILVSRCLCTMLKTLSDFFFNLFMIIDSGCLCPQIKIVLSSFCFRIKFLVFRLLSYIIIRVNDYICPRSKSSSVFLSKVRLIVIYFP